MSRKNYLIVALDVAGSAPGIVFKTREPEVKAAEAKVPETKPAEVAVPEVKVSAANPVEVTAPAEKAPEAKPVQTPEIKVPTIVLDPM